MSEDARLDAVMAIMDSGFEPRWREAWSRAQVRDSLAVPAVRLDMCDSSGVTPERPESAVAFALSRMVLDEVELLLIAVDPDHRQKGLGAQLIQSLADRSRTRGARRVFLEMRANNPAQTLYRRAGFRPIGVRPSYYRATDNTAIDAITFALEL